MCVIGQYVRRAQSPRSRWRTQVSENLPSNVRVLRGTLTVPSCVSFTRTIVIDVGKSFMQSAVEWFPKYGLRHIDAVLITHGHADGTCSLRSVVQVRPLNSDS